MNNAQLNGVKASDIINFWFKEISPEQWWLKDETFDQLIRQRFLTIHHAAIAGELFEWRKTAQGRLAEIIILDQFSRNIYRDRAQAFSSDGLALVLAQEMVRLELDKTLNNEQRSFVYLPYMHSESALIHQQAVTLYLALGNASNLAFEYKHQEIINRFGRYPHRNKILGRDSTELELAFLKQEGSSF